MTGGVDWGSRGNSCLQAWWDGPRDIPKSDSWGPNPLPSLAFSKESPDSRSYLGGRTPVGEGVERGRTRLGKGRTGGFLARGMNAEHLRNDGMAGMVVGPTYLDGPNWDRADSRADGGSKYLQGDVSFWNSSAVRRVIPNREPENGSSLALLLTSQSTRSGAPLDLMERTRLLCTQGWAELNQDNYVGHWVTNE